MHRRLSLVLFLFAGCAQANRVAPMSSPQLFDDMGSHHRTVTASSPEGGRYFKQGLIWVYAFNHDEAIRSFREAARLDPQCAMAWWGVALANGPHINNPVMDEKHLQAAFVAIQKALELAPASNSTERALIGALSKRYAWPAPADRKKLDEAYAAAMREVWTANREDADVGALFAEAMMDLRPWDLWASDGSPHPGTEEILATLEEVLRIAPNHPGANHFYIHAVEASPNPERAMAAADRLRELVPASGHLVHMPSHIDSRTGRWQLAVETNQRAISADQKYTALAPPQGFNNIYRVHNRHFLAYAAMMEGRSALAIRTAKEAISGVPKDYAVRNAAFVDGFMPVLLETYLRFGRWDDILSEPEPAKHFPVTASYRRFARATAYAARGDLKAAEREQAEFRKAVATLASEAFIGNNPASKVMAIADHVLVGEIAFRANRIDEAVAELRKAVAIEDALKYDDPPDWMQPVRHVLGAVLSSAGRHEEAEKVYREDLRKWPSNGWSLFGLWKCLLARGRTAEAVEVERRFKEAWARADISIGSSCLCASGKGTR